MSVQDSDATMAVFLDLENIALGAHDADFPAFDIRKVLERLLLKGQIVVKKAYCDFERYKTFKRSEEHTSELQSPYDLVCRLLLEKKKKKKKNKKTRKKKKTNKKIINTYKRINKAKFP